MNVLLTTVCNRKCSFCFAKSRMDGKQDKPFMDRAMVSTIMDRLQKEGNDELRLMGGEPTLHPEFPGIIDEAVERGFHILVFSNGMMPGKSVDAIDRHPLEKVSILCNISPQAKDNPSLIRRREAALDRLGPRMVLGVTISDVVMAINMDMYLVSCFINRLV